LSHALSNRSNSTGIRFRLTIAACPSLIEALVEEVERLRAHDPLPKVMPKPEAES
jgi:hypothetical protein